MLDHGPSQTRRTFLTDTIASGLGLFAARSFISCSPKTTGSGRGPDQTPEIAGEFPLWDPMVPLPQFDDLAYPSDARDGVVHRADAAFRFLHDNAVVWHNQTLFAAWYNCPAAEIVGASCIRGRRSFDQGQTWSAVGTIAADEKGTGVFYVPVTFLSHQNRLLAFVSNMTGHDLVTHCEVFVLDESRQRWQSGGFIAGPFLPNSAPLKMADGNFIMAGRMTFHVGEKPETPAVAISNGENLTSRWKVVPLLHGTSRPFTAYPETTLWLDANQVTAVVRGRLVFTSPDFGKTWSGPFRHNLPAEDSKPYLLKLSTDQICLLWNYPEAPGTNRQLLTLAVSRPGERRLAAMWKIRHGFSRELQTGPEWSYPCAVEHAGRLYIIYTSEKKHSVLTTIPLDAILIN